MRGVSDVERDTNDARKMKKRFFFKHKEKKIFLKSNQPTNIIKIKIKINIK